MNRYSIGIASLSSLKSLNISLTVPVAVLFLATNLMALSQDGHFCWTYSSISLSPNVIGTQNYIPCNLGAGFGGRLISHGFVVEFHFSSSTSIEDDLAYCILNLGSFFSCSIFFKNTIARVSSRLLIVCLMATWFRARLLFAQLCSTTHLLGSNQLYYFGT